MRPKFFFLFPLFFAIASAIVMALWNHVLVDVLPVGRIHLLQAAGILLLSRILFGRFGGGRCGSGRRRFFDQRYRRERWMNMSDEERARFRKEWKRRCGQWKDQY